MRDVMRAFVLTGHGGLEKLEFHTDWPRPEGYPWSNSSISAHGDGARAGLYPLAPVSMDFLGEATAT